MIWWRNIGLIWLFVVASHAHGVIIIYYIGSHQLLALTTTITSELTTYIQLLNHLINYDIITIKCISSSSLYLWNINFFIS